MRKPTLLLALAAVPAFAATANAGDPVATAAGTKTVRVGDSFFAPKSIKVRKGTYVKWVWGVDGRNKTFIEHNVKGYRGNKFLSRDKTTGSYRRRITRTTSVLCTIHPTSMRMKITVVP